MVINNFEQLENYFDRKTSNDDFYFVQVIQRKKDGVELPSYTSGARVIRSFYFFDRLEFRRQKPYIIELCNNNNARAYFWVNIRNAFDVACESIRQFTELIQAGNTYQGKDVYSRASGRTRSNKYDKLWIVDIDDMSIVEQIKEIILSCRGAEDRLYDVVPTVQGCHLITRGFDVEQFKQKLAIAKLPDVNVHKENPTLLYYNKKDE
jgi:hypothetical protein